MTSDPTATRHRAGRRLSPGLLLILTASMSALAIHGPTAAQEAPVAPYAISATNAGAQPIAGDTVFRALHGRVGINRIVDAAIDRSAADPRIADIFKAHDLVRLKRTLSEQICYLTGGGCAYTGRDMRTVHKDLGLQEHDFNALVEDLQWAMNRERVSFRAQNRLLAKLAPMERVVVER